MVVEGVGGERDISVLVQRLSFVVRLALVSLFIFRRRRFRAAGPRGARAFSGRAVLHARSRRLRG